MALAEPPDIDLPEGYIPSEDEAYMCPQHLEFFRRKLLAWKQDIVDESRETIANLQKESGTHPDVTDRASSEADRTLELRARDRQRKLIAKIDAALARIEDGSYGYCESTGDPIRLARLQARPIATLTIEAQERHEQKERIGN
jgi:DnaK suppressor protein